MVTRLEAVRVDERATRGCIYLVRGESDAVYLLDFQCLSPNLSVLRASGYDAKPFPALDDQWWALYQVNSFDDHGHRRLADTIRVGYRIDWAISGGRRPGWHQTKCTSIERLSAAQARAFLKSHNLPEPSAAAPPPSGPKPAPSPSEDQSLTRANRWFVRGADGVTHRSRKNHPLEILCGAGVTPVWEGQAPGSGSKWCASCQRNFQLLKESAARAATERQTKPKEATDAKKAVRRRDRLAFLDAEGRPRDNDPVDPRMQPGNFEGKRRRH